MDYLKERLAAMYRISRILDSTDRQGRFNIMTIGGGTIGIIWSKPTFIVLVRPSRFTYSLIKKTGDFIVNVPPPEMSEKFSFCSNLSRGNHGKSTEQEFVFIPAKKVSPPLIKECVIHYECRVVPKNGVFPPHLASGIPLAHYSQGDYYCMFYGEIMRVSGARV